MMLGWEIAKNVLEKRTSLEREMPDFQAFFGSVKPSDGFVNSDNRVDFTLISNKDEALLKIRAFAARLLEGVDVTRPASVGTRHRDLNDLAASSMGPDGAIDALRMESFEGSCGFNGGRGCDVESGPCSCGAWH